MVDVEEDSTERDSHKGGKEKKDKGKAANIGFSTANHSTNRKRKVWTTYYLSH